MSRAKANFDWWTKERVTNGLQRFIRDFYEDNEDNLPTNLHAYTSLLPEEDKNRNLQARLYPPAPAVLRHYESFAAAYWELGYLVEVTASNKKYHLTPEIEARLREIYQFRFNSKERPNDLPGPKEYARQLGFPEFVTTKWAQELGLAHTKEPFWSEAELELLQKHGYKTPTVIARIFRENGFKRTPTSILLMRRRRMVHQASPYFSMNAISRLFNTDSHVVKSWIAKGWMKFTMKGTERSNGTKQNGDTHLVHKDWIYEFIVNHPDVFDIKKVDQLWFLHIVTKGEVRLAYSNDSSTGKSDAQKLEAPIDYRKSTQKIGRNERLKLTLPPQEAIDEEKSIFNKPARPKAAPPKPAANYPKDLRPLTELAADKPHGHRIKYLSGCRCPDCSKANSDYAKLRRERNKKGIFNHLVPADSARDHILKLKDKGIGFKRVSILAGVNHNIIWRIRTGERKNLRYLTEQRILAVTSDSLAGGARVDAAGTWAKLEWLLQLGFSKSKLSICLGYKSTALQIGRNQIDKSTADNVEMFYNRVLEEKLTKKHRFELKEFIAEWLAHEPVKTLKAAA